VLYILNGCFSPEGSISTPHRCEPHAVLKHFWSRPLCKYWYSVTDV